jgi:hypothetical protein
MALLNRRRRRGAGPQPTALGSTSVFEIVLFLCVYVVWSSFTFPQNTGWKATVRTTIEKHLGWKRNKIPVVPVAKEEDYGMTAKLGTITTTHRIPCGLILVQSLGVSKEEDNVLPLATAAVVPTPTRSDNAESTLHARALDRYPALSKLVVTSKNGSKMIPKGTFKLRMDEATIEASPALLIVRGGDDNIDLVLGTAFWKDHAAEFGSDEAYLRSSSLSSSDRTTSGDDEPKTSRVMVPYLVMRSKPSFDSTEL